MIDYNDFKVEPTTNKSRITLHNFADDEVSPSSNPADGFLEVVVTPFKKSLIGKKKIEGTVLPFTKIKIASNEEEQVSILTDEQIILKTPATVKVSPAKLKVIVGSERKFE